MVVEIILFILLTWLGTIYLAFNEKLSDKVKLIINIVMLVVYCVLYYFNFN